MNVTHIVGRGSATGADVKAMIWNGTKFNNFTASVNGNGDFEISVNYSPNANYITIIQNNTADTISVMSSAAAAIYYKKSIEDTIGVDDVIIIGKKTEDSATINDSISFRVFIKLTDGTRVDSLAITDTIDINVSLKS